MNFQEAGQLWSVGPPVANEDIQVFVDVGIIGDAELTTLNFDACNKHKVMFILCYIFTLLLWMKQNVTLKWSFLKVLVSFNMFN